MGWFGRSQEKVWRQLCQEIGSEFVEAGFWKSSKVHAHVSPWRVTLDTHTVHTGHAYFTYTRMRAPFVNPEGFRFIAYRKGPFSELGKLLGMQHIEDGDPEFDEAFVVKGSDEFKIRELLADPEVRSLMLSQPQIHLSVKDGEGWFGARFPNDVDELHFQVLGVIKEVDRLKALFDLFAEILHQLCRIGLAFEEDPGVAL